MMPQVSGSWLKPWPRGFKTWGPIRVNDDTGVRISEEGLSADTYSLSLALPPTAGITVY
jgi:hypothetical protein